MIARSMTAEEFANSRFELPDGGRWSELVHGEPVTLEQPSDAHVNCVLNLSKAIANWLQATRDGYACFDLGLIVSRAPDTVLCPPISYFATGERWSETDKAVTETRPGLVLELASTPDRQRAMPSRIDCYREWGVGVILVVNTADFSVSVFLPNAETIVLTGEDVLVSDENWRFSGRDECLMRGFKLPLATVFEQPKWWTGPSRRD